MFCLVIDGPTVLARLPVAFGVGYYPHHHSRGDTDAMWALPVNVAQGHVIIEYLTLPASSESARIM